MSHALHRPSAGVRYRLEQVEASEDCVVYRGFAHLPGADLPLSVRIALPSGATHATLSEDFPELEKEAAALVRSATRAAVTARSPLPRKVVRWRG